jgi:hypothetical protein
VGEQTENSRLLLLSIAYYSYSISGGLAAIQMLNEQHFLHFIKQYCLEIPHYMQA